MPDWGYRCSAVCQQKTAERQAPIPRFLLGLGQGLLAASVANPLPARGSNNGLAAVTQGVARHSGAILPRSADTLML